jgi:hypothetical protein
MQCLIRVAPEVAEFLKLMGKISVSATGEVTMSLPFNYIQTQNPEVFDFQPLETPEPWPITHSL